MELKIPNQQTKLQEREYNFKCNVIRKTVNYKDAIEDKQHRADLIVLGPFEGSERDMLYTAWLDRAYEHSETGCSKIELPVFMGHPISMLTKVRLCQPNEVHSWPHLLVLSLAIEKTFNFNPEIKTVDLKVFRQEEVYKEEFANGRFRS